jgi:hypothetical protein
MFSIITSPYRKGKPHPGGKSRGKPRGKLPEGSRHTGFRMKLCFPIFSIGGIALAKNLFLS